MGGNDRSQIIWRYEDMVDDIEVFIENRMARHSNATRFVIASLSLGGAYAILVGLRLQAKGHCRREQFAGSFILSPMVELPVLPNACIRNCLLPCVVSCAPRKSGPSKPGTGYA